MKRGTKRVYCIIMALCLALGVFSCALAEGTAWTCPNCEQEGNTGNFCSYCGTPRPTADWTCPNCEQEGNTGNFCSYCGTPRPDGSPAAIVSASVNEHLEQIPGESERVKVCVENVEASSYILNKQEKDRWKPANAADGDESSCWQFSAKKGLKGKSWLQLDIGSAENVDEIWFKNGFWAYNDKQELYSINARPQEVRITFLYNGESKFRDEIRLTLLDEGFTDWQRYQIGNHADVTAIRIAIWSIYKGTTYPNDVCLSEVMPVQYASATIAKPPQEAKEARVYKSDPRYSGVDLQMELATRSGPGTKYDEPGKFFIGTWDQVRVRVLGKEYVDGTWWMLVDFDNGGKARYRVWTGLKRLEEGLDLSLIKEYYPTGQGTVEATSETFRGPGGRYARANVTIKSWKDVVAYGRENGYVEVEFQQGKKWYRLWVPESVTSIDWGNDNSGEN